MNKKELEELIEAEGRFIMFLEDQLARAATDCLKAEDYYNDSLYDYETAKDRRDFLRNKLHTLKE